MIPHGEGYIWVICSVCEGKFHRKDTIKVHDKYNTQNGKIVCKHDLDKVNPQSYPVKLTERPPCNPQHLTGTAIVEYTSPTVDDKAPSAPINPRAVAAVFTDGAELYWDAPINQGSSDIQGYLIERASPQLSTYAVVTTNSGAGTPYYNDTTANQATFYSYRIKAVNSFGSSPYSVEFYYPVNTMVWSDINYLVSSQDGNVITTGAGVMLRLNHLEVGVI